MVLGYLGKSFLCQIVLNTVKEVCNYRGWVLLAAHVRTNHVHLVMHANKLSGKIMNTIKSYSSRQLNAANLDGGRINRWTRHDKIVRSIEAARFRERLLMCAALIRAYQVM